MNCDCGIPWSYSFFSLLDTVKPVLSSYSKRRPKIGFADRFSTYAGQKLPFVNKTLVLSSFEWPLTGLQIRVCIGKLFSLFLIQNICFGYSKEPLQ